MKIKAVVAASLIATAMYAKPVATVNGVTIDSNDVNQVLMEGTQGRFMQLPPQKQEELKKRIIEGMITQELIYEDAKKSGILNSAEYKDELKKIMERVEKQLAGKIWQERQLESIKISDKELKDYYNKNKAEFVEKEKVHARHILVKDEDTAKAIINRLKNLKGDKLKEKFIEIAQKESTGPSAPKGGDLGYFAQGQMVPSFNDAVFSMKVGTITKEPVKSQFGYHVIYLEDKKAAKTLSFDEVKDFIKQRLTAQKFETMMKSKMDALKKNAKISYND